MGDRVAIVGVGHAGFAPITAGLSYKEQTFEAALRAYDDARIDPRRDVDSFVAVSEDFWEGTSIFDEYVPDQLGAALRPVHTVSADGLYGIATAVMLIRSGAASVVVVEGHSKASDILTLGHIHQFALDPVLNRPLDISPLAVAGLEMTSYLEASGSTERQCALVVEKNRRNALDNPRAAYPTDVAAEDVADSDPLWWPLKRLEVAERADGAIVLVLADEDRARDLTDLPVWIVGVGWSSGSPTLESRHWGEAEYVRAAGDRAYRMAGISSPSRDVDLAEVDDLYSYRELMSVEALRLSRPGQAGLLVEEGYFSRGGELPVNVSGGSLGQGNVFEANGLAKAMECVLQLREEAGERQVEDAGVAVAQSWRGVPTTSAAVAVFVSDEVMA
ncbi:MAG TPA: acetyl-CoA acetyltransferase [Actinomycetota bacterium]|jgi:acetyl-CoA C-acetyltransferase|nr:acetyl-CoA acetyltransferase [Actinomycetota bacterium]